MASSVASRLKHGSTFVRSLTLRPTSVVPTQVMAGDKGASMLAQLRTFCFVCALVVCAAAGHAAPVETKTCDLGELLRTPERMAAAGECAALYVTIDEQPISCGLYDKLSKEMKDWWVKVSGEICGTSEACGDVMAQCAARQLSGKDLGAGVSGQSSSGQSSSAHAVSNTSQPSQENARSGSTNATKLGSRKGGSGAPAPPGSQRGGVPSVYANSARSDQLPPSAGSSSSFTSSASSASSSSAGSSSSSGAPDCYVCIHDEDLSHKAECQVMAREARRRGIRNVVVGSVMEVLFDSNYREKLCKCKNIDTYISWHGTTGQEDVPFEVVKHLHEIAPACRNFTVDDTACTRFDKLNVAFAEAEELSRHLATLGYSGTVTVTGNQTITAWNPSSEAIEFAKWNIEVHEKIDSSGLSPLQRFLRNLKHVPQKMSVSRQMRKIYGEDLVKLQRLSVDNVCNQVNTPVSFRVCASGVNLALSPCKPVGHISYVDKGAKATQTIVCAKDGKRANQSCSYIKLKDVPDSTLPDGRKLREYWTDIHFGEDGCGFGGAACLCKWEEPSVCSL